MKKYHIKNYVGGWFLGDFEPSVMKEKGFEIGYKVYEPGTKEKRHRHDKGTEITFCIYGQAKMNDEFIYGGDIVIVEPGECMQFESITMVKNIVIKVPSVPGDKVCC